MKSGAALSYVFKKLGITSMPKQNPDEKHEVYDMEDVDGYMHVLDNSRTLKDNTPKSYSYVTGVSGTLPPLSIFYANETLTFVGQRNRRASILAGLPKIYHVENHGTVMAAGYEDRPLLRAWLNNTQTDRLVITHWLNNNNKEPLSEKVANEIIHALSTQNLLTEIEEKIAKESINQSLKLKMR